MKDVHSHMLATTVIGAAVLAADNTPVSIDRQGYEAVELLLNVGIGGITFNGTNKIEFKLTHSDDDSNFDAVTANDVLGQDVVGDGGIIKAFTSAHAAAASYRFGYKGGRRYLRVLADFSGTHGAGTPVAVTALMMAGYDKPEADQA